MDQDQIINRVASSQLITLNLEELYPLGEVVDIDLKDILYQGMILREKDLRDFIKSHNWQQYLLKNIAIYCSEDAVIPTWAYMLLGIALQPFASKVVFGNRAALMQSFSKMHLPKLTGISTKMPRL